jgi:basic membrane lipoprotein Med (substrate-binding protein (PBP1-ABC) superfamily)
MRYLLFGGDYYYPSGGADDLISMSNNLDKLKDNALRRFYSGNWDIQIDWFHIYDVEKDAIVYSDKARGETRDKYDAQNTEAIP